ncbi:MAG TPA: DMT family transporter [Solirubrobacteraceae bacterium]|nr:DMT family transporter [Solirubrobacteraceae bacterium]
MTSRGWLLFAAASVLFGTPYLFVKLALDGGVEPVGIAFARAAIAAAVLVPLAAATGGLRDVRGRWPAVAGVAVLGMVLPFVLVAVGEQTISSSLAGILVATAPIWVALLALAADRSERFDRVRGLGLAIGFAGVVALLGVNVTGKNMLLGALAVLALAVSYATATLLYGRLLRGVSPLGIIAAAMAVAAGALAAPAALAGADEVPGPGPLAALAALGILSTAAGYVAYYALVQETGAGRTAVTLYINPVVAVLFGVALLGESLGAGAVVGLLLIVAGSRLSMGGSPGPGRADRGVSSG